MSRATRLMAGLTLVLVPTIQLGGSFLLTSLIDRESGYMANALRQNFFRAGHAHAGVLTILALVGQILVDAARLPTTMQWLVRVGMPASGIRQGHPVKVVGLVAQPWTMGDRSGVAFRAARVEPVMAQAKAS